MQGGTFRDCLEHSSVIWTAHDQQRCQGSCSWTSCQRLGEGLKWLSPEAAPPLAIVVQVTPVHVLLLGLWEITRGPSHLTTAQKLLEAGRDGMLASANAGVFLSPVLD